MKWFWGLLFIMIGVIVLGGNLNWWADVDISSLFNFWPILLVLIGISILFRHWRYGWIIMLCSALLVVAFLAMVAITGVKVQNRSIITTNIEESLPSNTASGTINIKTGAIELNVEDGTNKFIEGQSTSNFSSPSISIVNSNGKVTADIKTTQTSKFYCCGNPKNTFNLKLSDRIPLDINVDAGATSLNLDLDKIILKSLSINAGASSIKIKLADTVENDARINIKAGASSVDLSGPKEVGVELTTKTGISSKDFIGFEKIEENKYRTSGFDNANKKIFVTFETGVSSLKITRD